MQLFSWPITLAAVAVLLFLILRRALRPRGPSPFASLTPLRAPIADDSKESQERRLRVGYSAAKVPNHLDAIVIGSGISGLTVAGLLSLSGKRVLVLESHDRVGGNMHTFEEKGFEFGTGVHYIGNMNGGTMTRFLLDQISGRGTAWADMDPAFDNLVLGFESPRRFAIGGAGKNGWRNSLLASFPSEGAAIDGFLALVVEVRRCLPGYAALKVLPLPLVRLLRFTGAVRWLTRYYELASRSVSEVINGLTTNVELRAALTYAFGDYATAPDRTPFTMHAMLVDHYLRGASYPVGGPASIPLAILPTIEAAGGAVLVRAPVAQILIAEATGAAMGVRMKRDGAALYAPLIVSSASVMATLTTLVPPAIATRFTGRLSTVRQGPGCMSVFIGLRGSAAELALPASNTWAFASADLQGEFERFMACGGPPRYDPAFLFISFPAAKDPSFASRYPGKATCEVVTMASYEWFEQWQSETCGARGAAYNEVKDAYGAAIWARVCQLFPQLAGRDEYLSVGTPLTLEHYLAQPQGGVYGLDHDFARFNADWLRPDGAGVPGLWLTGQDIMTCGLAGAMVSGLLTTSAILNRNLFGELSSLKRRAEKAGEWGPTRKDE